MTHYVLTVPVTYTRDGEEKTSYRRVGAIFQNQRKGSDETLLQVRLDFPVGATELVAFPPRSGDVVEEDG